MNDENNEEEFGMEFRAVPLRDFFEGMQAQQDHVQMHADVVKHEMMDFVRNLSKDQLIILDHFAGLFVAAPDAGRYYQGVIAATLENKFNVCAACRQNHDEQAQEIFNASGAQAEAEEMSPEMEAFEAFRANVIANMEMYNVEAWGANLLPDQKDKPYPPSAVRCKNCGMQYVSLEDRMLKGPEPVNCDGCVQKMKTG